MKFLTAFTLAFLLFSSPVTSQNTFKLGFTGAYPNNYQYDLNKNIDWSFYDELNLNYWAAWGIGETRLEVIDSLYSHGMSGYFDADTIRWAAYGHVVFHEAELTPSSRFQYIGHTGGVDVDDNGIRARYFEAIPSGPYNSSRVLFNAHQNRIQSYSGVPYDPNFEINFPGYPGEPEHYNIPNTWYIKPRMRINVGDVAVDKPVVRIIVLAYNGDTILNQPIFTSNFKVFNNQYDGRYIDEYRNLPLLVDTAINRGRTMS